MAAEEGAEPLPPITEDRGASSASAPAPSLPPLAPTASGQVPNTADMAKAAAAARALQSRAEILSTSQLLVPQAAPSQPTAASTALAAVQVNPDPETQAEANMEAMRQNMTCLQDMLRQMQEQQQAYEAARRAKAASTQSSSIRCVTSNPSLSTSTDPAPSATSYASASVLRRAAFDCGSISGPSRAAASSAGRCPSTLSAAWPSVTSNGRRGFGSASATSSSPSTT
nr:hypothetical protein LOC_Os10g08070 [Oryza sativa Japonica Group]